MGNDQSSKSGGSSSGAPRAQTRTEAARARAVGAIQTQKQQMGVMEKRIVFHEKKVAKLRREAKALMQSAKTPAQKKVAKRKAMQKLKQVKLYEKQIMSEQKKIDRLMTTEMALEGQVSDMGVIEAQRVAANAMASAAMDVDEVEDIIERGVELRDQAQEISDLLAEEQGDGVDEDELMDELREIEELNAMEDMEALPTVPDNVPALSDSGRAMLQQSMEDVLPVAPAGPIPVAVNATDEDEELAALEAMMA